MTRHSTKHSSVQAPSISAKSMAILLPGIRTSPYRIARDARGLLSRQPTKSSPALRTQVIFVAESRSPSGTSRTHRKTGRATVILRLSTARCMRNRFLGSFRSASKRSPKKSETSSPCWCFRQQERNAGILQMHYVKGDFRTSTTSRSKKVPNRLCSKG